MRNRLSALATLLLALAAAALLWRAAAMLPLHFSIDPNEGWNAHFAAAAMGAGPLYPAGGYTVNNYPPLAFYLVGALGNLCGDAVLAGRLVSLAAFLFVVWGIFAAAVRLGCTRSEGAFAALLFALGMLSFTDYVAMNDPQMLAHALATGGFLILLKAPRTGRRIGAAALLFVLAFFVKHNVAVMAAAMLLWLFFADRKAALRLAGVGLAFLAAGLLSFRLAYGVSLLAVVASARSYDPAAAAAGLRAWLGWNGVAVLALAALLLRRRDGAVRLVLIYAGLGILAGLVFLGGAGVDANALFDADIALALVAALALDRLGKSPRRAGLAALALAAPVLWGAWQATGNERFSAAFWRSPGRAEAALSETDIAFVRAHPGPALCALPSFCIWAGKPMVVDFFNAGEAFKTGARSDADLVRRLRAGAFSVVQLDPGAPAPLGPAAAAAMRAAYRLDHADDCGSFYVPIRSPARG